MTPTVVYVHGIGNKPSAERLKLDWDRALLGRDAGSGSVMAYWADLRYPQPLPAPDRALELDDDLDRPDSGPKQAVPALPFVAPTELIAEARAEVAHEETLDELALARAAAGGDNRDSLPRARLLDDRLDPWLEAMAYMAAAAERGDAEQATARDSATDGIIADHALEALPLPASARTAAFRALVKVAFADVYAYFFGGQGEAIKQRLRDVLHQAGAGPLIIIGHSLGSVIAYDVLRENRPALDIPLLTTIGSPLAVTEIQDLIARPLLVPHGVHEWRNVADGWDFVALDKTIRPEFTPTERTLDFLVDNTSNTHHGGLEYLQTAPVRSAVASLLR